jgi:hypothetical protein
MKRHLLVKATMVSVSVVMMGFFWPGQSDATEAILTDDATVAVAKPANSSRMPARTLRVLGPLNSRSERNSYLKFDFSPLPAGTTGTNIDQATLILYASAVRKTGTFDVVAVNGAWTESAVTSATVPPVNGVIATGVEVLKNDFVTVDLTGLVRDWVDGVVTNYGVALIPNTSAVDAQFDSKETAEGSNPARLIITIVDAGANGVMGSTGAQGLTGSAGPTGTIGAQGLTGPAGPTGTIGAQGLTGPAGPTGTIGAQGLTGPAGPTGTIGAQGLTGSAGPTGTIGAQGLTGPAGPTGAVGALGMTFRGAWASGTTYTTNDVVTKNGSSWIAVATSTGVDPATDDDTHWTIVSASGLSGSTNATLAGSDTTTVASYTDLGTIGPAVTVTVPSSGNVLVTLTAFMSNGASSGGYMSFQVDATAATDATSLHFDNTTANYSFQGSATYVVSGLPAGSHTFTVKYRSGAGTETFANRSIIVIPLP